MNDEVLGNTEGYGRYVSDAEGRAGGILSRQPIEAVADGEQDAQGNSAIYIGDWTITAYCSCWECCGEWSGTGTASGSTPTANHTVACNSLPFGTQLVIDGITYTVEDTGYSPYGDAWIDIYFDSHDEALAYGVQIKEVYLVA